MTYDKTVHVIFPAEVRYVDLGSPDLIAGKADGAENVIRVKATAVSYTHLHAENHPAKQRHRAQPRDHLPPAERITVGRQSQRLHHRGFHHHRE